LRPATNHAAKRGEPAADRREQRFFRTEFQLVEPTTTTTYRFFLYIE
jgi:hypothetical protein